MKVYIIRLTENRKEGFMCRLVLLLTIMLSNTCFAELDWAVALEGDHRSEANKKRDVYRHPRETLEFFGLEEGQTVVELSPGGGWYTEVLAPLTRKGTFYAAHFNANAPSGYAKKSLGRYLQKLGSNMDIYGGVVVSELPSRDDSEIAPAGSVDMIVAFRNIHSWLRGDDLQRVLKASHSALKPGGTLGIVQHRSRKEISFDDMKSSGYVTEQILISMVEEAGFKLEARSEINGNTRDPADHPKGVWNLPPSFADGEKEKQRYIDIGESDRMTLRFKK